MSRVDYCANCHKPSVVGEVANGKEVCACCASVLFNVSEYLIAKELISKCPLSSDEIISQISKLAMEGK